MQIVYCDKCGMRINVRDLEEGRAVKVGENNFLCATCSRPAVDSAPAQVPAADLSPVKVEGANRAWARRSSSGHPVPGQRTASGNAASASAPPPGARKQSSNNAFPKVVFAVGAGVLLLAVVMLLGRRKTGGADQTGEGMSDASGPVASKPAESIPLDGGRKTESPGKPSGPVAVNPPQPAPPAISTQQPAPSVDQKTESMAEREQRALKEMQELREKREALNAEARQVEEQRAAKLLEEHREWFKENPAKAPEYKQRLRALISSSRGTAAAKEAQGLADGIKLPGVSGRFVRVELSARKALMMAEVQVFSGGGESIAIGKKASQSNTFKGAEAKRAIDGNTDGNYFSSKSVSHTGDVQDPWWEVDLGREETIDTIAIWNRMDMQSDYLKNFTVKILKNDRAPAWSKNVTEAPKPSVSIAVE